MLKNGKRSLGKESGITCALNQNRPNSRGSVHIVSSDAMTPPQIKFNFLAELADRQALVGGVRLIREFMVSAAMREIGGDELLPGLAAESDDDILDYIRSNADTGYHPVGTCKMGHDRDAVVDENLLVHGIEGLRIGDASIMPTLTSGNTNAPTIMIAEKCSDMVRKKHEI